MLSSAQQVPKLTFPGMTRSSIQLADTNTSNRLQDELAEYYGDVESTGLNIDGSRRGSDLYNPELNLKAHQTAQQVTFQLTTAKEWFNYKSWRKISVLSEILDCKC